jgi:hypothetical protein
MKTRKFALVFAIIICCTLLIGTNVLFAVNPMNLIIDLITGFLNILKDLFFGWFTSITMF